jgi:hypothetical protein
VREVLAETQSARESDKELAQRAPGNE